MNEKILVVDDEPLILTTIERTLSKKGYHVRTTPDAETFLSELKREDADLLIMDVNIAGVSSESLVDRIRQISPASQMLFISGVTPKARVDHFLEKPFDIEVLRENVRSILGKENNNE